MFLLADQKTNAKTMKNSNTAWNTSILYLAPADVAKTGVNLCPASTEGCRSACLFTAGRGKFSNVFEARIRKTKLFVFENEKFMQHLCSDLEHLVRKQQKTGIKQAVRLNGTSDICWENQAIVRNNTYYTGVPQAFPELLFYDYTKRPTRVLDDNIKNYKLTFSLSEATPDWLFKRLIKQNINVAVVFDNIVPDYYLGVRTIDGTLTDERFLDPTGVVVGLLAKGKAKADKTGFVKRAN